MSALRLAPAVIFALGAFAFLAQPHASSADETALPGSVSPSSIELAQSQAPKPQSTPKPKSEKPAPPAKRATNAPESSKAVPQRAGCTWIGKRVVHSLLRDDAVTAGDFERLYRSFSCSEEHLRASFDCTVASGALPTAAEAQTRVDSCWNDPKFDTNSLKIAPLKESGASSAPKSGASKGSTPASKPSTGTPNYPAAKSK